MCEYFQGSLTNAKIIILLVLIVNVIFSITTAVMLISNKELGFSIVLGVSTKDGAQVNLTSLEEAQNKPLLVAIIKTAQEEMSQLIVCELIGFFAVLFESVTLICMHAASYFLPSVRITLNLAFGKSSQIVFLVFMIIKVLSAFVAFIFACLVNRQPDSSPKRNSQLSGINSSAIV